jgi:hypothetical protein
MHVPAARSYRGAVRAAERRRFGTASPAAIAAALLIAGCASSPTSAPSNVPTLGANESPASSESPTQLPIDTSPPTPGPTAPTVAGEWRAVQSEAVAAAQLQEVTWTGTQFVATGAALAGGGVFLRSTDGQTWKSATAGGTAGWPSQIAAGASGVVATGTLDDKTASWFSPDGIHWNYHLKVFPQRLGTDDTVGVNDVIATGDGWLAVGADGVGCVVSCVPNPIRGLVWTSTNGLDWTRLANQSSLKGGGLHAVVAIDGGYVAGGDAGGNAAFWTSPDGAIWTRVADDPSFATTSAGQGVQIVGLAVHDGTIAAVGMESSGGGDAPSLVRAWSSTDGRTWSEASVDGGLGGQVFSVAATTTGFLATGPSGAESCLGGIWSSSDGTTWACAASDQGFDGFAPNAAASGASVDVAVGLTNAGCGDDGCPQGLPGAVWWRPVP